MKPNLLSEKKVIITVAITGGIHGKWATSSLPITPEEQAQDALECYNSGASILHLHVRDPDGQNTADLNVYNEAVKLIGEKCPIIRQIGNGIGARLETTTTITRYGRKAVKSMIVQPTLEERLNLLTIEPIPEMSKDKPTESPFYFDEFLIDTELQELMKYPIDVHTRYWKKKEDDKNSTIKKNLIPENEIEDNGVKKLF